MTAYMTTYSTVLPIYDYLYYRMTACIRECREPYYYSYTLYRREKNDARCHIDAYDNRLGTISSAALRAYAWLACSDTACTNTAQGLFTVYIQILVPY